MNKKPEIPADWRIETMSRIRTLIKIADPVSIEEVKWKKPTNPAGIPVWYHDGVICTGETYKKHIRLTFAKGNFLKNKDPKGLINAFRAVIINEGEKLNEAAFKNIIRAAVALNRKAKNGTGKKQVKK